MMRVTLLLVEVPVVVEEEEVVALLMRVISWETPMPWISITGKKRGRRAHQIKRRYAPMKQREKKSVCTRKRCKGRSRQRVRRVVVVVERPHPERRRMRRGSVGRRNGGDCDLSNNYNI